MASFSIQKANKLLFVNALSSDNFPVQVSEIVPAKRDIVSCTDQQQINDAFQLLIANQVRCH